jgi:opacity protein-like surface antigen
MGLACISGGRGLAVAVILREARPLRPMVAVIACIGLLAPGSPVRAQTSDDFTMALDRYDRAVNQAEAFVKRLEGMTCISAVAFPGLQKQADRILAAMKSTSEAVVNSNPMIANAVHAKQLRFWEHDEDRADDIEEDIGLQLYRLQNNPCPPEQIYVNAPLPRPTSYFGGGYIGIQLAKTSARERKIETPVGADDPTFRATDSGDPLGVGIVAGYNFRPWNNNIGVGPFASFDYLRQTINHDFAGGQFLGSTTHWFGNVGVKAGFVTAPGVYIYGLAGAAFVNHDLNVNFATAAWSNVTTPGATVGLGAEYQPSSWQLSGHPVTLFASYQHTWWDTANFNRPTSSPGFNYAFQREDDTFKLGVNFYFAAAPASPPAYPVKAPALK